MDYGNLAAPTVHDGWRSFCDVSRPARLILLTTRASETIWDFAFQDDDILLMGRESAGAPEEVHHAADARLRIPLASDARSLNITVAAAVALAEARRQLGWETS